MPDVSSSAEERTIEPAREGRGRVAVSFENMLASPVTEELDARVFAFMLAETLAVGAVLSEWATAELREG